MVLVENFKFLHPFFRQNRLKKVFCAVLDRKQATLDYQNSNLRAAFRKYRPTVGTSLKFDFAHFWLINNP